MGDLVAVRRALPGAVDGAGDGAAAGGVDGLGEEAREYAANARASNTRRAYRSDWAAFVAWCEPRGRGTLPASVATICDYLVDLARTHRPASIRRRLSSISMAHGTAGYESPTRSQPVRLVLSGICRELGTAPVQKAAAAATELRMMLDSLPGSIQTQNVEARKLLIARDRAILLTGFFGAFRRSELASLEKDDVGFVAAGMVITLRKSKTDQTGQGKPKAIPSSTDAKVCPVKALKAWIRDAGIETGPLFRHVDRHARVGAVALSGYAVSLVVKRAAAAAGLDASQFAGHSLRAGFITAAASAGASDRKIMEVSGHRSRAMVDRYVRSAEYFKDNAGSRIRL